MRTQVRDSALSGRSPTRRRSLTWLLLPALAGCATLQQLAPASIGPDDTLSFLSTAIKDTPPQREALWKATLAQSPSLTTSIHKALLESVDGHSGYDPVEAQKSLRWILAQHPPEDVAALLSIRLDEVSHAVQCQASVADLQQRLNEVVDIERKLSNEGR